MMKKFSAKESREGFDGQEEPGWTRDPAFSIKRETTAWNDPVDMGMMMEVGSPGMEDSDAADFGSEMSRVFCDLVKCFPGSAKEMVVDDPLVLVRDGCDLLRKTEDDVEVFDGKKIGFAIRQPMGTGGVLASWAMSIPTGVEGKRLESTVVAPVDVSTFQGRPTCDEVMDDALLLRGDRLSDKELLSVFAEDVRHFECGLGHRTSRFGWRGIERAFRGKKIGRRHMGVHGRSPKARMTQENLNGPDVDTGFEEMSGITVSQSMCGELVRESTSIASFSTDPSDGPRRDWPIGIAPWKEPLSRLLLSPVLSEKMEKPFGEGDVSILAPLALSDTDGHSFAVDVDISKVGGFSNAKTTGVAGAEDGSVFDVANAGEKVIDLLFADDEGKSGDGLGTRDPLDHPVFFQCDSVEESKGGDALTQGAVGDFELFDEVDLVVSDVLERELVGGLSVVLGEPCDIADVGSDGVGREVSDAEIFEHSLSEWRHRFAPFFVQGPGTRGGDTIGFKRSTAGKGKLEVDRRARRNAGRMRADQIRSTWIGR